MFLKNFQSEGSANLPKINFETARAPAAPSKAVVNWRKDMADKNIPGTISKETST